MSAPFDYVLVTAVRNEARFLPGTMESVAGQTIAPRAWIIVNDNSTDSTGEIIARFAQDHACVVPLDVESGVARDFSSKVFALREGFAVLPRFPHEFVGILDGDITLPADYYERVIAQFSLNPRLGIAGGTLFDVVNGMPVDRVSGTWSVSGGIQLFRRKCFGEIGEFLTLRFGGEDWVAEVKARMFGWQVQSFPDITGLHHRPTGSAGKGALKTCFDMGRQDYFVGVHPLFEMVKVLRRAKTKPYVTGVVAWLLGFFIPLMKGEKRCVPPAVEKFLRREELQRLGLLIRGGPLTCW